MELNMDEIQDWKSNGLTWREIGVKLAEKHGGDAFLWSDRARKRLYHRRTQRNLVNGDKTSEISEPFTLLKDEDLNDNESLLRLHGYDPEEWSVVDSSCTIRANSINTRVKVKPNSLPKINVDKLTEALTNALENVEIKERTYSTDSDDDVFVNMFDLHYGRKYREQNHITTESDVLNAIDNIVDHYKQNRPRRVYLPIGQDIFNTDNAFNTTTKGTPQTNSLEWYEMYAKGVNLVVNIINKLSIIAPVHIIHSKGNHSAVLSYTLVQALALKYEHCNYVHVNTSFDYRQYIELDNVLIGLSHNNEEKKLIYINAN